MKKNFPHCLNREEKNWSIYVIQQKKIKKIYIFPHIKPRNFVQSILFEAKHTAVQYRL